MATIAYHTLNGTQTVTLTEPGEYKGETIAAGPYDVPVAGRYWSDFDRANPREPMECCVVVAARVRTVLGLKETQGDRDGPMARYWAAKSAMPPKPELDAIAPRAEAFRKLGKSAKVAVYPVRVAGELDVAEGASLAKALAATCAATPCETKPAIDCKPAMNEQLVLWTVARQFRAHLQKSPADADYALLADFLMSSDRKQVGAVHFVLCTRQGDLVAVDYQNDHHDDFRAVAPKSPSRPRLRSRRRAPSTSC